MLRSALRRALICVKMELRPEIYYQISKILEDKNHHRLMRTEIMMNINPIHFQNGKSQAAMISDVVNKVY